MADPNVRTSKERLLPLSIGWINIALSEEKRKNKETKG